MSDLFDVYDQNKRLRLALIQIKEMAKQRIKKNPHRLCVKIEDTINEILANTHR